MEQFASDFCIPYVHFNLSTYSRDVDVDSNLDEHLVNVVAFCEAWRRGELPCKQKHAVQRLCNQPDKSLPMHHSVGNSFVSNLNYLLC